MKDKNSTKLLRHLCLSLMPIQALATGLPALNILISSGIVGNVFGSSALAAMGFCVPFTYVITGCARLIAVGSQLQCGKYLGEGNREGIAKIFSTAISLCFIAGILLTCVAVFFSNGLATLLGTTGELHSITASYLKGYSFCCIGNIFSLSLVPFLQLDNAKKLSLASLLTMAVGNIFFNLLNAFVLHWGIFGVGLSASVATLLSVLICIPHFAGRSKLFRYSISRFSLKEVKGIAHIGINSALLFLYFTIRDRIFISFIASMGGTIAVSAFAIAGNIANSLGAAIQEGANGSCNLISSVLIGSRDVDSLRAMPRVIINIVFPVFFTAYICVCVFAKPIALLFGADLIHIAVFVTVIRWFNGWFVTNIFRILGISIYTSLKKIKEVGIFNFLTFLVFPIIVFFAARYANSLRLLLSSTFISEFMVEVVFLFYYRAKAKRMPKLPYDYIYIPREISVSKSDSLAFNLRTVKDASEASESVINFCKEKGLSSKTSYWCGLCIEEMATDTIIKSFPVSKNKNCSIDVRVFFENSHISIMIRDDCNYFNPNEWLKLYAQDDPMRSIGIKMVKELSQEMIHNSTLGMNILTIKI